MEASSVQESVATERSGRVHARPDRRVHPRVASCVPATVFAFGATPEIHGTTCDIGAGGICFQTDSPMGMSDAHRVDLELPTGVVSANVQCRWQRESSSRSSIVTGLAFVGVERSVRLQIWRHVHSQALELAEMITSFPALSRIPLDVAVEIALYTRVSTYAPGSWIYRQGSLGTRGDSAFFVLEGEISVECVNAAAERIGEEWLGSGSVLGGFPMVSGLPHPETAIARTEARLLEIDPFAYGHLACTRPEAAQLVTEMIASRYGAKLWAFVNGSAGPQRPPVHRYRGETA